MGKVQEAIDDLLKTLELNPENEFAKKELKEISENFGPVN